MYRKIIHEDLTFSSKVQISDEAKDIIEQLLVKDPEKRLGY